MIVLVGKSGTGKDTIKKELMKREYKSVVTYTTRPPREGEIDGVAYHFISSDDFLRKLASGFFAEFTSYNVSTGDTWYYGTAKGDLTGDKVIIVNPSGLKALYGLSELNAVVFLIETGDVIRMQRLIERGDDVEEIKRRIVTDDKDFLDVHKFVDTVIVNDEESIEDIADVIVSRYREVLR